MAPLKVTQNTSTVPADRDTSAMPPSLEGPAGPIRTCDHGGKEASCTELEPQPVQVTFIASADGATEAMAFSALSAGDRVNPFHPKPS